MNGCRRTFPGGIHFCNYQLNAGKSGKYTKSNDWCYDLNPSVLAPKQHKIPEQLSSDMIITIHSSYLAFPIYANIRQILY